MWEAADGSPQARLFEPAVEREPGRGEFRGMEFLHVRARSIINEVKGTGGFLPFRYTINAYRGCSHACTYCFARPTHAYLDMDIAGDFDRRIVVKVNAVERLRAELHPARWAGHHIAMGTNTDPYQRCEGKYHLTQGIVGVLSEAANPFSILTKSTLVLRDLDLLAAAARRTSVQVDLSIGTLDEAVWRATEPGAPHPRRRVEAVRALNEAGIASGVLVAPVLPGLSDSRAQIEEVVHACLDAGATWVSGSVLHLRPGVRDVFLDALATTHPGLVARYEQLYQRVHAPKAERQRVSQIVRTVLQERGLAAPRDRAVAVPAPARRCGPADAASPATPAAQQLGLALE